MKKALIIIGYVMPKELKLIFKVMEGLENDGYKLISVKEQNQQAALEKSLEAIREEAQGDYLDMLVVFIGENLGLLRYNAPCLSVDAASFMNQLITFAGGYENQPGFQKIVDNLFIGGLIQLIKERES